MYKYGLIGYPLEHSFSKKFFNNKFETEQIRDSYYELYPIECIEEVTNLIEREKDLRGLNVTIPYKQQILRFLNELDNPVKEIGAVNCIRIVRKKDKIWLKGYNTDVYGFESSLHPLIKPHHKNALILGTGGAAKAVEYALNKAGIHFKYVSRTSKTGVLTYEELNKDIISHFLLIINTSPLGMYPNTDKAPALPYQHITGKHLLYDLVYNPENTKFMQLGKKNGAVVKNGMDMLIKQAEKAWDIWNP